MSLSVLVKSASGLPNVERFGESDPVCVIVLQGEKKSTKVIDNNLNPEWNETLKWTLYAPLSNSEQLHVKVFDYEKLRSNRLLGTVQLPLQEAISRGSQRVNTTLKDKKGQVMESKINLELTYKAPERGGGSEEYDGGNIEGVRNETRIRIDGEGEKTNEQGSIPKRSRSVAEPEGGEAAHRARRRNMARNKLPNKPMDWQVRIHVIEARRLVGGLLNPVVKVACGTISKQTSARKGTNNPLFNEMLYFNFNGRPQEMFDRMVEIKILHNQLAIKHALIGSFKFDLGMVYDEPEQSFLHKWLLLADPDNPASGNKGYLKISINVVGPGDQPKSLPASLPQDSVDIEKNLLRPAGVQLQPATLVIKIFRGEDMPLMDPAYFETVKKLLHFGTVHKELVDPYCTVSFAGKKGETPVIWHDQEPKWNYQINLGIRFPSMSERIRFQVMDRDKVGNDDFIGTTFISMSEISAGEEKGFLPTFGPCFLNVYGSPREFTDLPDKYDYLNKGMIEGVAYRGRIMVELEVQLGNFPTAKEELLPEAEQTRIRPFLRRCGYKLYGIFFSATMIHPANTSVEFEVSIGNYGNKLDTNTPVQPSTTLPSNPFYDGQNYYYLPWLEEKPCVVVESQWEDCSYRIISMNILLGVADRMEVRLAEVKKEMALEKYCEDTVKGNIIEALDEFIDDLCYTWKEGVQETGQPLPPLVEGTKLDKWRRNVRIKKWNSLKGSASHLRNNPHTLEEMVSECDDYIATLRDMAIEPQQCIPDVIIWMLAGNKRVAYCRIPAHTLYYTDEENGKGKLCGKVQTLFLTPPAVEDEKDLKSLKDGAQVRLMLWLEMEKEVVRKKDIWASKVKQIGGEFNVYAETFENETYFLGKWEATSLTRPHWSDSQGKVKQEKEDFKLPPGWSWFGDWKIHEPCTLSDMDDSREDWLEEIYEHQARYPLSSWPTSDHSYWTDVHNDPVKEYRGKKKVELTKDDILCPEGWKWCDSPAGQWQVDMEQAVDKNGWEYCLEAGLSEWVPYERNGYLFRRRRWVRRRIKDRDQKVFQKKLHKQKELLKDGWEYARMANLTYHITEYTLDFARRRRWARKLEGQDLARPAVFHFKKEKEPFFSLKDDSEGQSSHQQVPRVFVTFHVYHTYQLRAYLYQARDMYGSDKSGLSDPYTILSFLNYSDRTRTITQTVSPTWDQTILIKDVRVYGDTSTVETSPPTIVLVFMDKDTVGQDEFIGQTVVKPVVRLSLETAGPRLDWYPIIRYNKYAGELLAAFELLLDEGNELPFNPPTATSHSRHIVPFGIRPVMQWTRVEILCWGVRAMKRFQLLEVTSPLVEFECGGMSVQSKPIKNTKENPNFPDPVLPPLDVYLPIEELYTPPLNIKVMEERSFGRCPLVGTYTVKSLSPYLQQGSLETHNIAMAVALKSATPAPSFYEEPTAIAVEDVKDALDHDPDNQQTVEFDWWSKYYCSRDDVDPQMKQQMYIDLGYDTLKIYPRELEKEFDDFQDFAQTFRLYHGKGSRDPHELKGKCVGVLKASLKVYALSENRSKEPLSMFPKEISIQPIECVVRVYIIRGEDLAAQDPDGKSDPYIKVKVGKGGKRKEINDEDNYIPSNLNPVFGKMFELPAKLPIDHTLTITVMDWDRFTANDLIGETTIDLENRFISQYRGTCGLPNTFCKRGVNKWRDRELPVQILEKWCDVMGYQAPTWFEEKVIIDGVEQYTLRQFEGGHRGLLREDHDDPKQRLALHVLKARFEVKQLKDKEVPVEVLEKWCDKMEYQAPEWFEEKVIINGLGEYTLRRFEQDCKLPKEDIGDPKQRLALHVIKTECKFVPEHVEKRTLYNPLTPGIRQGFLHMWVDIFPNDGKLPPAVDISPRKPDKYELRVVVYNTKDVVLDEISVVTGEAMSDIYVKGWLRGQEETQKTDVHYRSMDGEGNFNWRMVFPFEYLPTERTMVVQKKEHFYSLTKTEIKVAPCLTLQVWDNDIFTPDDFIGTIDFDLTAIPEPVQDAADSCLDQLPEGVLPNDKTTVDQQKEGQRNVSRALSRGLCCICCRRNQEEGENTASKSNKDRKYGVIDLFHQKRLKGWWPVFNSEFGTGELMGKLELEIEVLTEAEALLKPAGKARDDPNMNPHLDEPNRPATSFLWFTSPLKSFQYIIWRHYKWHIVGVVVIVFFIVLLVILIYTAPSQFMNWLTNRLLPV